ncbi:hypothetical protein [Campylobacter iguaniorum]|uniref:hypothetical protein n=1 Tax=Campylobacter iguaniorum TaxID=1244531 RepID=UPI001F1A1226|nr:hypothetical protein [Campylobacter iguaniorum]
MLDEPAGGSINLKLLVETLKCISTITITEVVQIAIASVIQRLAASTKIAATLCSTIVNSKAKASLGKNQTMSAKIMLMYNFSCFVIVIYKYS